MDILIEVAKIDEDIAKSLGGTPYKEQKWIIPNNREIESFHQFTSDKFNFLLSSIYLLAIPCSCPKCWNNTLSLWLLSDNFMEYTFPSKDEDTKSISIKGIEERQVKSWCTDNNNALHYFYVNSMPFYLFQKLIRLFPNFSYSPKCKYWVNHCEHCGLPITRKFPYLHFGESENFVKSMNLINLKPRYMTLLKGGYGIDAGTFLLKNLIIKSNEQRRNNS